MRIAIVDPDRCKGGRDCPYICLKYCPGVRMGDETIVVDDDTKKPVISETLCSGCGICVNKCPFNAITIINLLEPPSERPVHRYGENAFRLFGLPIPRRGKVVGIIGQNGVGKTTAIRILSGEMSPNLGDLGSQGYDWEAVSDFFRGSELQSYFQMMAGGEIRPVLKPQNIAQIPKVVKGTVEDLLTKADERGAFDAIVHGLELEEALDKEVSSLSGGELQRLAIGAALSRDGNVYFFDEPSSYLDIFQRLNVSKMIRGLASEGNSVVLIEHDMTSLDYMSDYVHILVGQPGAYGVVSAIRSVGAGINAYLDGFLQQENLRIRPNPIRFTVHSPFAAQEGDPITSFTSLVKTFGREFSLTVDPATIYSSTVIGVFGPNAIGKSTFVRMIAGDLEPDDGEVSRAIKVSYKPQYVVVEKDELVSELLRRSAQDKFDSSLYKTRIIRPLGLSRLLDLSLSALSGGELQKVAVAEALSRDVDLYVLDEPTAHIDVEDRLALSSVVRNVVEKSKSGCIVVDHDTQFLDVVSDNLMIFEGKPGVNGHGRGPFDKREGMNRFLRKMGITYRRDYHTGRPRINKEDSKLDKQQKRRGEYYYIPRQIS